MKENEELDALSAANYGGEIIMCMIRGCERVGTDDAAQLVEKWLRAYGPSLSSICAFTLARDGLMVYIKPAICGAVMAREWGMLSHRVWDNLTEEEKQQVIMYVNIFDKEKMSNWLENHPSYTDHPGQVIKLGSKVEAPEFTDALTSTNGQAMLYNAVSYSVGRMTYMPEIVMQWMKQFDRFVLPSSKIQIVKLLGHRLLDGGCGTGCDVAMWHDLFKKYWSDLSAFENDPRPAIRKELVDKYGDLDVTDMFHGKLDKGVTKW